MSEKTGAAANDKPLLADMFSSYPEVMSIKQVSEALNICPNTIRALLNQRILRGKKIGYKWRVLRADLCEWLLSDGDD